MILAKGLYQNFSWDGPMFICSSVKSSSVLEKTHEIHLWFFKSLVFFPVKTHFVHALM